MKLSPLSALRVARTRPVAACLAVATLACRTSEVAGKPQIVQPGAPGEASRVIAAEQSVDLRKVGATPADVMFMQGMIGHHAQAIEMTSLLASHTASEKMRALGQRIGLSQADEISLMTHWLSSRRQEVPDPHAMHMHGATLMPGMLGEEEMTHLAEARGPSFDRLFLAGMIKHHGGALTMVEALFAQPGAAQDSDIFAFASDVDTDQRMEIARMSAMLEELPP